MGEARGEMEGIRELFPIRLLTGKDFMPRRGEGGIAWVGDWGVLLARREGGISTLGAKREGEGKGEGEAGLPSAGLSPIPLP